MFQVQHCLISDDIATFMFACDLSQCKGNCCVVGDAGAPVHPNEIPVLNKAWRLLKEEMRDRAKQIVDVHGLITNSYKAPELNCTDGAECVFVIYGEDGIARCGIEKAWEEGRLDWRKPISCHLFPVRIMHVGEQHFLNLEYVPSLCQSGCSRGKKEGIYLSEFLKEPLIRAYGEAWFLEFRKACEEVRVKEGVSVV
ncbi:DUF3109 family protein [Balneolaceae bacterium ANBcel3]|nr:DUF3109 family protein [Balneolaceae bacterium ANBcel3]